MVRRIDMKQVEDIIVRASLLLALDMSEDHSIAEAKVRKTISDLDRHLAFLQSKGIKIASTGGAVRLETPLSIDLYQTVPPEIRTEVDELVRRLVPLPPILEPGEVNQQVIILDEGLQAVMEAGGPTQTAVSYAGLTMIKRGKAELPLACIHCAEPQCHKYPVQAFGPTDTFPSRVCPTEAIKVTENGRVEIDGKMCAGCMICIIRCPISVIELRNGIATKNEYSLAPPPRHVLVRNVSMAEKQRITETTLKALRPLMPELQLLSPIESILDNFEQRSGRLMLNWGQNPYYLWVRNCLRELGLEAAYTGSAGKLKRADITVKNPFAVGIEVKSPAEGDINTGAIRQAVDAAREVTSALGVKASPAVIGGAIARGAHARAVSWAQMMRVNIPLIRGRCLLYVVLKHKTALPQDPTRDVKRLFTDYNGWIGREELLNYFAGYFDARRIAVQGNDNTLPMPRTLANALVSGGAKNHFVSELDRVRRDTEAEITRCFPDPKRTARGGYAKK